MIQWEIKPYEALTRDDVYSMLQERTQVFVVEQNCPYLEVDGYDRHAYHVFGFLEGRLVAYSRILPAGTKYQEVSIGRVLVQQEQRGKGLARELMLRSLAFIQEDLREATVKLQAQEYLQGFYGSLGFEAITDVYLDDGIPHLDMLLHQKQ